MARCEVEPELDWSGALRCVHLKSSRNPAAKRNRAARAPRCIVRSRLSSVYCERLSPLWVKSGHQGMSAECPLYPQKQTLLSGSSMSALCQKRTLMGFAVRWRNVFDRNYVAFQALLDLCHSALWLVCRCLPCVFERYFGSPC